MRADRLLAILLLLQARGQASARELADRLEVSERTIYRDMEALSAAGVPVYTERGRTGGCRLLPGFHADVTGLTPAEARALFMFGGHGAPGGAAAAELRQALSKLLAGLPAEQRAVASAAQERMVVDARPWHQVADDPAQLSDIQRAVWQGHRLALRYRSADAVEASPVRCDPYGLLVKSGQWYLIAAVDGEPRVFRVSRVDTVETLAEPAARPAGLDLEALWRRLRRRLEDRGEGVVVRLRVRAERARRFGRLAGRQLTRALPDPLPPAEGGWVALEVSFVALGAAQAVIAGFGTDVRVDGPAELRAGLLDLGRGLVELYESA